MKKRITYFVLLIACILLFSVGLVGCNINNSILNQTEKFKFEPNEDGYSITRYIGNNASVIVPYEYQGKPVTSIGSRAFEKKSATSVLLPNTIKHIGNRAFADCSSLIEIRIPDSIEEIGDYAFNGCYNLTSVTIPNSVTRIGWAAFENCTKLASMTLPFIGETKDGVENTHFGYIFGARTYSLNYSHVPSSVKSVEITLQEKIPDYAFYNCQYIQSITIGERVERIGDYAFNGCRDLKKVTMSNSVTSIGKYAFNNCALETVTIPDSIAIIEDGLFYNCGSLISITIPYGVTRIGNYAFAYSRKLTTVMIPASVTNIGEGAFDGCWELKNANIPSSITHLSYRMFTSCQSLESITIPNSVVSMDAGAFAHCTSMTNIIIPNSVQIIGDNLLYGSSVTIVYYVGTVQEWNEIEKNYSNNERLALAEMIFYSETEPTQSGYYRYWHYDTDGVTPIVWE